MINLGTIFAQNKNEIIPNGYNKFYYPNGQISSEGNMEDAKPVGIWKSYLPDGTLKTEGARKNDKLDGIWKFYDNNGYLKEIIDYRNGDRNGYCKIFINKKSENKNKNILISKELYLNNEKSGKSYYYDETERLIKTVEYDKGYKHGLEKIYDNDGKLITILKYFHDNLSNTDILNRTDKKKRKQGTWKEFYQNENIKTYANYRDNLLHGYYREYDIHGKLIKNDYYEFGKKTIIENKKVSKEKEEIKNDYYNSGKLKYTGAYKKGKPIGVHKEYSETGEIVNIHIFDKDGFKKGIGNINKEGKKHGNWKFVYPEGNIRTEGEYKNGKRTGTWSFFFKDGGIEQKGIYKNGKPYGNWVWYYDKNNIRRKGKFKNGREEGLFFELSKTGDTLSKGEYKYGKKDGQWIMKINDHKEIGKFVNGKKEGKWSYYFADNIIEFEGNFLEGKEQGVHKFYYPNGKIKLIANYRLGVENDKWKYYDESGNMNTVIVYKEGEIFKIDGNKIKEQ